MEFGEYIPENFLNEACYRLSLHLEDAGWLSGATPCGRDITSFRVEEEEPEPKVFLQGFLRFAARGCQGRPRAYRGQQTASSRPNSALASAWARCSPRRTSRLTRPNQYGVVPEFCHECGFRCVEACPRETRSRATAPLGFFHLPLHGLSGRTWSRRKKALTHFRKLFRGKPPHHGGPRASPTPTARRTHAAPAIALCPMDQGPRFRRYTVSPGILVRRRRAQGYRPGHYWRIPRWITAQAPGFPPPKSRRRPREFGADLVGISSCAGYEKALPGCKPEDLVKGRQERRRLRAPDCPFGKRHFTPYGGAIWNSAITGTRPGSTSSHTGWRSGSRMKDTWRCPRPPGGDIPSLRILREGPEPEVFMQGLLRLEARGGETRGWAKSA